jgi:hypothetical protein
MDQEEPNLLERIRAHYGENRGVYHLFVGLGVAALVLLLVGLWLLASMGSGSAGGSAPAPAAESSDADDSGPGAFGGLLLIVILYFVIRAMLRGTFQIYGAVAYFGLFAAILALVIFARELPESMRPYLAWTIALAVVLGAFIEIGSRIAFRLSEINKSLGDIKEAIEKQTSSMSNE